MSTASPRTDEDKAIAEEAARWFTLHCDGALKSAEKGAFETWRCADPRHAEAYASVSRTFDAIKAMPHLAALAPAPPARRLHRFALPVALAAAALFAVALLPLLLRSPTEAHRTEIAQLENLTLSDGTVVTIGAASEIDVRFTAGERRVRLTRGEAFFEVTHDPARPFFVEAGDTVVRVVGTKFGVNRSLDQVRVSVAEGVVEVREPPPGLLRQRPEPIIIRAGERAEVREGASPASNPAPSGMPVPAVEPGAWRTGRIVYDDVRLADLVADLNRYYPAGVIIADPALADLRLAAAFRADEIDAFLGNLPLAADVRVARDARGAVTLSRGP